MNPVIGLDVSKGESQVQAFLDKGKPYRKSFSITHDLQGLGCLLEFLQDVEKASDGHQPSVVLESTGHYHIPVIQYLEEQNYVYIIVNPLISHRAKSSSLRKVKTDAIKRGIQHYHLDGHLQLSYQNGVMLFNPEQTHDGMAHDDTGLEYVMLYIEPRLLLEALDQRDMILFSNPIVYNKNIQYQIMNLAKAVFKQENEHICDDLFLKLADSLIGYNRFDKHYSQDSLIHKIKDRIRTISRWDLRIDMITNEFSMSKFQFIRFFKSQTGITPYQFFLNCKIEGARQTIEKERDVNSAVSEYQFVDLTHLNRQFKKIYGLTATEYSRYMDKLTPITVF